MPENILTTDQMYEIDAAMTRAGISEETLMHSAARAVADAAFALFAESGALGNPSFFVICGSGKNAGDGYAAAWMLGMRGAKVTVLGLYPQNKLPGASSANYDIAYNAPNVTIIHAQKLDEVNAALSGCDKDSVIIDAILGIGLSRRPSGLVEQTINAVNAMFRRVLAVDIPSGVDGTSGQVDSIAIQADWTVTFQNAKLGHYLYPGRKHTGKLIVERIGFHALEMREKRFAAMLTKSDMMTLRTREPNAHKGDFQRGLLVAGSRTMAGAAIICAKAAARAGAGMFTSAVPQEIADAMRVSVPESMLLPMPSEKDDAIDALNAALKGTSVVAAGPGMGRGGIVTDIIRHILSQTQLSILLDADALNALGEVERLAKNVIITPHPGEMERLCGIYSERIARTPVEVARKFAKRWQCTIVLKGATSVVAGADGSVTINATGNAGLARGGSGDMLTGIIFALLCQNFSPYEAARTGAYLLGRAADIAVASTGERAMLPNDVIDALAPSLRGG